MTRLSRQSDYTMALSFDVLGQFLAQKSRTTRDNDGHERILVDEGLTYGSAKC